MNVLLIPLIPFLAALTIGLGIFSGFIKGEASERKTALIATSAITLACLLAVTLVIHNALDNATTLLTVGQWLTIGSFSIPINFIYDSLNIRLACLFSVLLFIVMRFSVNYMHREVGFHRFFFMLSLFAAAMLWLVLAGNAVMTFIGWEMAGLCSYLLIAYFYDRPVSAVNATQVFITNRIGDAGFILGIGLSYHWLHSIQWQDINAAATHLSAYQVNLLALCFTLAAFVKSAQLPFTPWLARAMEGPTPSSAVFYGAVMIHAGVYLLCLLQPLLVHAPLVMVLMAIGGGLTALYSVFVGLTQTDVKSSLVYAASGQIGLMFLACGLGWWHIAQWHLAAHAVMRGYQFLNAPSLMHHVHGNPIKPVHPQFARLHWAYMASLQRGWLEPLTTTVLINPIRGLARDLNHFDVRVLDRLMGVTAPVIRSLSSLAQNKEQLIGAHLDNDRDEFAAGSGLAGKLTEASASLVHWFEDRIVLGNHRQQLANRGRALGHTAQTIETLILRPRNLALLVLILLLSAF